MKTLIVIVLILVFVSIAGCIALDQIKSANQYSGACDNPNTKDNPPGCPETPPQTSVPVNVTPTSSEK